MMRARYVTRKIGGMLRSCEFDDLEDVEEVGEVG